MGTASIRPGRAVAGVVLVLGMPPKLAAAETVHVALGDVLSVETLSFAKERGDYELTAFSKEEPGIQALADDQAQVPLRIVVQLSRLVFFPVVANEYQTWKDLDGLPFAFHARATGTEAVGNIIAAREGIAFGERSYVPGSENRIVAMMNGQIKATIVDLPNKNLLMEKAGDRFHVLPGVDIVLEDLLGVWRDMNENPKVIEQERAKYGLLEDLPQELLSEVTPYYTEGVETGLWAPDGGSAEIAKRDFAFYTAARQLEGPPASLKVEEFWYLAPLERAKATLGG